VFAAANWLFVAPQIPLYAAAGTMNSAAEASATNAINNVYSKRFLALALPAINSGCNAHMGDATTASNAAKRCQ